jgi:DNA-binding CsgD family transcriptional regulator
MNGNFVLLKQSPSLPFFHFDLAPGRFLLGRSSTCDCVVSDASVSRRHAEIAVEGESVTVRDLDSLNGTFVNEKRVRSEQVQTGQHLRFGAVTFLLTFHQRGFAEPASDLATDQCGNHARGAAARSTVLLLSPAQRRVLDCLLEGLAEKRIARRLGVSPHTVHNHVQAIYHFLGVHSRSELLARLLHRNGDLGPTLS